MRAKKCKACKETFTPSKPMQSVCGMRCAIKLQELKREKAEKAVTRKAKEAIKTRAQHAKDAQTAFNAYIRERDYGQPCISCGTNADVQYCAGHYRTVGACPELRFEPLNVHRQCNKNCNLEKSGNVLEYRIRLIKKIGEEKLAWLEGPHNQKKYTIPELIDIKAKYRALTRELIKKRTAI